MIYRFLLVLLLAGCATTPAIKSEADRRACDELIAAVKQTWQRGGATLSNEGGRFAAAHGLSANLSPNKAGGYDFLPRLVPFALLAAAGVDHEGSPVINQYRDFMNVRTPAQRASVADEGRRCEW